MADITAYGACGVHNTMMKNLASFCGDKSLTDFTITCGTHTWRVHSLVLCLHSSVFSKACKGDFKEATERKLDLSDDHPACLSALVRYMYHCSYLQWPQCSAALTHDLTPMTYHVQMCIMADKYDIQPLKILAIEAFQTAAKGTSTAEELAGSAALAYQAASATGNIGKTIIDIGIERSLLSSAHRSPLGLVMETVPEFARDYARALEGWYVALKETQDVQAAKAATEKRCKCPNGCPGTITVMFSNTVVDGGRTYYCPSCATSCSTQRWRSNALSA